MSTFPDGWPILGLGRTRLAVQPRGGLGLAMGVLLDASNLQAQRAVEVEGRDDLPRFLRDLSTAVRWNDARQWESSNADLALSAYQDNVGHIAIEVRLGHPLVDQRGYGDHDWRLIVWLEEEPAHVGAVAAELLEIANSPPRDIR